MKKKRLQQPKNPNMNVFKIPQITKCIMIFVSLKFLDILT